MKKFVIAFTLFYAFFTLATTSPVAAHERYRSWHSNNRTAERVATGIIMYYEYREYRQAEKNYRLQVENERLQQQLYNQQYYYHPQSNYQQYQPVYPQNYSSYQPQVVVKYCARHNCYHVNSICPYCSR